MWVTTTSFSDSPPFQGGDLWEAPQTLRHALLCTIQSGPARDLNCQPSPPYFPKEGEGVVGRMSVTTTRGPIADRTLLLHFRPQLTKSWFET